MLDNSINPEQPTIMFFEPANRFHDHYKRPYRFDIKNSHMERIDEYINDDRNRISARGLMGDASMMDMVSPTPDGYHVRTSQLNDRWMFIAVLPDGELHRTGVTRLLNKKFIMGYTTQEPFGRNAQMAPVVEEFHLNPSCNLIITKSIKTSDVQSATAGGGIRRTTTCNGDYGSVSADDSGLDMFDDATRSRGTTPDELYGLDSVNFDKSLQDVSFTEGNTDIYNGIMLDDAESLHRKRSITVPSAEHSPLVRSQSFLTSLKHATTNARLNNTNQVFSDDDYMMDDMHTISNDIRTSMANEANNRYRHQNSNFSSIISELGAQSSRVGRFCENTTDTMVNARQFVRNTNAKIVYQRADIRRSSSRRGVRDEMDMDILPQDMTSKTTLYSSIIAAIVPTMMSSIGLATISFRYDTANDVNLVDAGFNSGSSYYSEAGKRGSRGQDMYEPCGPWSLIYPATDQEQLSAFRRFIDLFRMELVPILREAARGGSHTPGEFSVYCMSSINGDTHVKLTFKDGDGYYKVGENVVYKDHTILGGIVSPLLGRRNDLHHNVQAVKQAILNSSEGVIHEGMIRDGGMGLDGGGMDDLYFDDTLPQRSSSFESRANRGYREDVRGTRSRHPDDRILGGDFNQKIEWE